MFVCPIEPSDVLAMALTSAPEKGFNHQMDVLNDHLSVPISFNIQLNRDHGQPCYSKYKIFSLTRSSFTKGAKSVDHSGTVPHNRGMLLRRPTSFLMTWCH